MRVKHITLKAEVSDDVSDSALFTIIEEWLMSQEDEALPHTKLSIDARTM